MDINYPNNASRTAFLQDKQPIRVGKYSIKPSLKI